MALSWKRVTRPVLDRFPVSVTGSFITLTHAPVQQQQHHMEREYGKIDGKRKTITTATTTKTRTKN